ncbi:histone acetyltransferase type b catalytic subunit [Gracilaria domingensis]|nr:histone acetyltransferase type b catalytic subunit [Gracilaria domingensis]
MAGTSPQPPARKRVRFDPTAGADGRGPGLPARDCVQLRFVRSDSSVPSSPLESYDRQLTSVPSFLHQIVPRESVYGWDSLRIAVYVHMRTLATWIDSVGDRSEADPGAEATDVPALLSPFIKDGLCSSRAAFEAVMTSEPSFLPFTNQISSFSADGVRFGIFKEKFLIRDEESNVVSPNTPLLAFHHRMAFLMLIHIDDASFIDVDDERWELFAIARLENGRPVEFVAYSTVYPFSALTSGNGPMRFAERIRISQVFVMPVFQRSGHGSRLLNAIYEDAQRRNALQITVEDPSPGFRLLRDVTDLRRAYDAGILDADLPLDLAEENNLMEALGTKLLLTPGQARRCVEVHQLRHTNRSDEEAYKKYRLWVKRRLFKANLETLDQYDKEERKEKLAEIYAGLEMEYDTAILRVRYRPTNKR